MNNDKELCERGRFLLRDWDGEDRFHCFNISAPMVSQFIDRIEALQEENAALVHDNEQLMKAANIEANLADELQARVEELEALAHEAIAAWNDVVPYHRPGGRALGRLHLVMANLDKALKDTDND